MEKRVKDRNQLRVSAPLVLVALIAVVTACGGGTAGPTTTMEASTTTAAGPTTTVKSSTTTAADPTTTAAASTTTASPDTATTAAGSDSDLLTEGKLIFDETAGDVGCAHCHGASGKGDGVAGAGATDIRGKTKSQIDAAISGGVPQMSFIKLTPEQLDAVAAYVAQLP